MCILLCKVIIEEHQIQENIPQEQSGTANITATSAEQVNIMSILLQSARNSNRSLISYFATYQSLNPLKEKSQQKNILSSHNDSLSSGNMVKSWGIKGKMFFNLWWIET